MTNLDYSNNASSINNTTNSLNKSLMNLYNCNNVSNNVYTGNIICNEQNTSMQYGSYFKNLNDNQVVTPLKAGEPLGTQHYDNSTLVKSESTAEYKSNTHMNSWKQYNHFYQSNNQYGAYENNTLNCLLD